MHAVVVVVVIVDFDVRWQSSANWREARSQNSNN